MQTPVAPDGTPATIEGIAQRYRTLCNDTIQLRQESPVWTPGAADAFEMELRLRPRLQPLFVQPNLDEVLKQGFVQCAASGAAPSNTGTWRWRVAGGGGVDGVPLTSPTSRLRRLGPRGATAARRL